MSDENTMSSKELMVLLCNMAATIYAPVWVYPEEGTSDNRSVSRSVKNAIEIYNEMKQQLELAKITPPTINKSEEPIP